MMMPRHRYFQVVVVLIALLGVVTIGTSTAQTFERLEETQSNIRSYHYHVQTGRAAINVHVLGTVHSPGAYRVTAGTELGSLLALAGGPPLSPRSRLAHRTVLIKVYSHNSAQRSLVYEATLDEMVTEPDANPVLKDGDVIYVEVVERRGFGFRDALSVAGGLAALALATERIIRLLR